MVTLHSLVHTNTNDKNTSYTGPAMAAANTVESLRIIFRLDQFD